jgi:hypothetical protein
MALLRPPSPSPLSLRVLGSWWAAGFVPTFLAALGPRIFCTEIRPAQKIGQKGDFLYNAGIREDIYRPDDPFLLKGLHLALEGRSLSRRRSFLVLLFLFLGSIVRLLTRAGHPPPTRQAQPGSYIHPPLLAVLTGPWV